MLNRWWYGVVHIIKVNLRRGFSSVVYDVTLLQHSIPQHSIPPTWQR